MRAGLNPHSPLARLLAVPMRPGVVQWIGLRPARRAPMLPVLEAVLSPAEGLAGDRYASPGDKRQVTLIGAEHLQAIASFMGREAGPEQLRRNIVVSGVNLHALGERPFWLGGAVLQATGECHPCSRMEETLGVGGYNAVRRHGGVTARVLEGGVVRVGDGLMVQGCVVA